MQLHFLHHVASFIGNELAQVFKKLQNVNFGGGFQRIGEAVPSCKTVRLQRDFEGSFEVARSQLNKRGVVPITQTKAHNW